MRFFTGYFLKGAVLGLYGMARTFLGGTSLSLFLIKTYELQAHSRKTLELLREYLDIAEKMTTNIPPVLNYLTYPWNDYLLCVKASADIVELLIEAEHPPSCEWYWQQPGYPEKKT